MLEKFETVFHELETRGWSVQDHLLPDPLLDNLLRASGLAWEQGLFHPAHVGRPAQPVLSARIRGDNICWLEPGMGEAAGQFQDWADDLQQQLNRFFFLGLRRSEFHFARYEQGTGYKRHLDQHRGQPHRKISVVLYLNRNWGVGDGGELTLFAPDDLRVETHRILPCFGRTVFFRSDLVPHAVQPARRTRWSLTGWFRSDSAVIGTITPSPASNDDDPGSFPSGRAA